MGALNGCYGGGFVVGKFENLIEPGYVEYALRYDNNIAENEAASALRQQISQYQQITQTRRSYYFNSGEIDYNVTIRIIADGLIEGFKLIGDLRFFGRQISNYKVFRRILNAHFCSLSGASSPRDGNPLKPIVFCNADNMYRNGFVPS